MIVLDCSFIVDHVHEFPDDWRFSGPNGLDFRADPRWKPAVYEYYSERIERVHVSVVPACEMEALDYCTQVAAWGKAPKWVSVKRPGEKVQMLPWLYDAATDEVEFQSV